MKCDRSIFYYPNFAILHSSVNLNRSHKSDLTFRFGRHSPKV
jgi:hypothetical protein